MPPTRTPKLAPYLAVPNARELVRFLETALGGTLSFEESAPDGRLVHAEVRIADGLVMIGEPAPGRSFPGMIHLYVPDADRAFQAALQAGATPVREPTVAPDGDRRGGVRDAWGNEWWFTTPPGGLS
jgi:PhnB protein